MPRNPKNPKDYTTEPRQRYEDKLDKILELLVQFHHSTRHLLLLRLGLATHSHHTYFKKLEKKGILRRAETFTIRSRTVFMLTPLGKELAAEKMIDNVINYTTDASKINHSSLRHDLAVQKAVITRLHEYDKFMSEKFLPNIKLKDKKKPDAFLEKNKSITALEVELTAKSDQRIFRALNSHAQALLNQHYQQVLYIFPSNTLKNYYQERFNQQSWPVYQQNEHGFWIRHSNDFFPEKHPSLCENFKFIYEKTLLDF
jgi:DNA-binding MarR family transcriptional regulator